MILKYYDKYIDSNIQWIGEIPKHWECRKINTLSSVSRGASPRPIDDPIYFDENGEYSWVRISDVTSSKKYLNKTTERLSTLGKSLSVPIEPGNIFVSIAATVGKPIISNIKCCIHDGFVYFKNLSLEDEYLFYIFKGEEAYKGLGKLGTQLNLNTETIGRIYIPVPSKEEQKQIVSYLDKQTTKIDKTISKNKQLIDLLEEKRTALINQVVTKGLNPEVPMKDSGIEWIGEIPEHWEIIKGKHIFKIYGNSINENDIIHDFKESYNSILFYKVDDMNYNKQSLYMSNDIEYKYTTIISPPIPENSILIPKRGAAIATNKVKITTKKCFIDSNIMALHTNLNSKFYAYFILGRGLWDIADVSSVPQINNKHINYLDFVLLPIEEQMDIVLYLDEKLSNINNTINKIQINITLLEEYKTSLIHHVVTGKIDVRGEEI